MYTRIFLTYDEQLEELLESKCQDGERVRQRLTQLGYTSDFQQTQYLDEYTGVLYTDFMNGGLLENRDRSDLVIREFLEGSWKRMTNKYFMINLVEAKIKKGFIIKYKESSLDS